MRKIFLILCFAFFVVAFGYPCIILPYTNYTYTYQIEDEEETNSITLNFKLNGKVTIKGELTIFSISILDDSEIEMYYKLNFTSRTITIAYDEDFDIELFTLSIANIYTISGSLINYTNTFAIIISIAVAAATLVLILTIPSRRRR